ncbi:MAG: DUF2213 domain-containing protein [Isosphaeraceae bacterium]
MSVALDAKIRYFGQTLSSNIAESPEGYLLCLNTVIGRSGPQKYLVSELTDPEGLVKDRDPGSEVEVWRPPEEVFRPATIASFEGKTFTLRHPPKLIGPDDEKEVGIGHCQNVRKGSEALESGDWPMVADIMVKDPEGIRAVKGGERELSCGYSYRLVKNGERLEQHDIIGNHVALVQSARAGGEARINDAAPKKESKMAKDNILKQIWARGLKAFAADEKTTPEDLAEVMDQHAPGAVTKEEGKAEPPKTQLPTGKVATDDDKAKDDDKRHGKDDDDRKSAKDDRRSKLHSALDKILTEKEEQEAAGDVDLDELKSLLTEFFTEEKKEPAHEDNDAIPEELKPIEAGGGEERRAADDDDKKVKDDDDKAHGKDDDKGRDDDKKAAGDSEVVRPEPELEKKDEPKPQFDEARAILRTLKPFVAKSGNKKLIAAYDSEARRLRQLITGGAHQDGSYSKFLDASHVSMASDAQGREKITEAQKMAAELDAAYKKERTERTRPFKPVVPAR